MPAFETNLMRLIAAQNFLWLALQLSRDLFGKPYCTLSVQEKQIVDQQMHSAVSGNYTAMTAELLERPQPAPNTGFGFQHPQTETTKTGS